MKCLLLISSLFACATWTCVHTLAAAGQPAVAEIIPPLPTLSPPVREVQVPPDRCTTLRGPARSCGN